QRVLERIDGKTCSYRALRARVGGRRNRRGCPVLQESVVGAADGERRNSPGILGVLSEVPEQPVSGTTDSGDIKINGGSGCPNPPFIFGRCWLYCTRPVAVSAFAFGFEHNELARAVSAVVAK